VRENYLKAVSENKLEPLGQPEIQMEKMAPNNPLQFKAKISVLPEFQLPDYKKVVSQVEKKTWK